MIDPVPPKPMTMQQHEVEEYNDNAMSQGMSVLDSMLHHNTHVVIVLS